MKTVAAAVALGGGMVYYARFLMFDDHTMIHLNAWWSSIKKRRDVVHNPTTTKTSFVTPSSGATTAVNFLFFIYNIPVTRTI